MDFKTINPAWRLSDPLTVNQAAALIAGFDPVSVRFNGNQEPSHFETETGLADTDGIAEVQAVFYALTNSIQGDTLQATIRYDLPPEHPQDEFNCGDEPEPEWAITTVRRVDLIEWLKAHGFNTGFFFPVATDSRDYLDPKNPRYAPKLAAAVKAWEAVTDPQRKTPKQALTVWLRENAAMFGLTDEEGRQNETGIDEVAKVANWKPGGAAKTPGG
jgi:hypothetical protein